jgi:NTE family protein
LALSGGAARGQAHVGVLKVLEEHRVPVDFVAGTSAGSFAGALYCAGLGWREISEQLAKTQWGDLVRPQFSSMGLINSEKMENHVNELISGKSFAELDTPLGIVAVDIVTGEEIVFNSGSVARAVRASSSIPGIFAPVEWEGHLLVDGGVRNNVPASVVEAMGAEYIISVDVNYHAIKQEGPDNFMDVLLASMRILMNNNKRYAEEISDVLIRPNLEGYNYYNLSRGDELVRLGEEAALASFPDIREAVL